MSVVFSDFGVTPDGRRVLRAEIANGELKAAVISYGAALAALEVPCGDVAIDVALGYDRLEDYIAGTGCLGGTPGRCANRIARGRFTLDGNTSCRQTTGKTTSTAGRRAFRAASGRRRSCRTA